MTRNDILRRAAQMVDVQWTPTSDFRVLSDVGSYGFRAGIIYSGMPYHWWGDDDLPTFLRKLPAAAGPTQIGNDCSSFVQHAWAVPDRLTTASIAADAAGPQRWCRSLGTDVQGAGLLPGDACNAAGSHVILVERVVSDGVLSVEQTPGPRLGPQEMRRHWSWSWLSGNGYLPVRRQDLTETPAVRLSWDAVSGATWYRLWVSRDDHKWFDRWLEGVLGYTLGAPLADGVYRWWVRPWSLASGSGDWLRGADFVVRGDVRRSSAVELLR